MAGDLPRPTPHSYAEGMSRRPAAAGVPPVAPRNPIFPVGNLVFGNQGAHHKNAMMLFDHDTGPI